MVPFVVQAAREQSGRITGTRSHDAAEGGGVHASHQHRRELDGVCHLLLLLLVVATDMVAGTGQGLLKMGHEAFQRVLAVLGPVGGTWGARLGECCSGIMANACNG